MSIISKRKLPMNKLVELPSKIELAEQDGIKIIFENDKIRDLNDPVREELKNIHKKISKALKLEKSEENTKNLYSLIEQQTNLQKTFKQSKKLSQQNIIKFSLTEKELLLQHKKFLKDKNYNRILKEIGENISSDRKNEVKFSSNKDIVKLKNFLAILTEFTNDPLNDLGLLKVSFNLLELCSTVENAKKLISKHAISKATQPIHDLEILITLPNDPIYISKEKKIWNKDEWFKLCMNDKKAFKLLARADEIEKAYKKVPKNFEAGLEILKKISYPAANEILTIDESLLSSCITKEKLTYFTELCIIYGISTATYNEGLRILTNNIINRDVPYKNPKDSSDRLSLKTYPKIKERDNLPPIVIDGKDIGEEYKKYYMMKLPIGDVRGLLLGQLSNCCQYIGSNAHKTAIDGMVNEDSGYYVICEKDKDGKIDIENNRIIAQSFTWLGNDNDLGKTLTFDSWERLGLDNNKLLDPFYSKFADVAARDHNIAKVTLGKGGNFPHGLLPFRRDLKPTQFKDNASLYTDAAQQVIILDKQKDIHPYDKASERKRSTIKLFEYIKNAAKDGNQNLDYINDLMKQDIDINVENQDGQSLLHIAQETNNIEFAKLLLKNNADVNMKFIVYEQTVLHCAALDSKKNFDNYEFVRLLIEKGADVNAVDGYNDTALHYCAAQKYSTEPNLRENHKSSGNGFAKLLLDAGANVNAEDKHNKTPLFCAMSNGDIDLIKLLIVYGANTKHENMFGDKDIDQLRSYDKNKINDFIRDLSENPLRQLVLLDVSYNIIRKYSHKFKNLSSEDNLDNLFKIIMKFPDEKHEFLNDGKIIRPLIEKLSKSSMSFEDQEIILKAAQDVYKPLYDKETKKLLDGYIKTNRESAKLKEYSEASEKLMTELETQIDKLRTLSPEKLRSQILLKITQIYQDEKIDSKTGDPDYIQLKHVALNSALKHGLKDVANILKSVGASEEVVAKMDKKLSVNSRQI